MLVPCSNGMPSLKALKVVPKLRCDTYVTVCLKGLIGATHGTETSPGSHRSLPGDLAISLQSARTTATSGPSACGIPRRGKGVHLAARHAHVRVGKRGLMRYTGHRAAYVLSFTFRFRGSVEVEPCGCALWAVLTYLTPYALALPAPGNSARGRARRRDGPGAL